MPKSLYFVGFIVIAAALLGGQLLRFSIAGFTVTLLDAVVLVWVLFWLVDMLTRLHHYPRPPFWRWWTLFVIIALISLVGALRWVGVAELVVAGSYLARWVAYALLVYLGYNLGRSRELIAAIGLTAGLVALVGIVQWWLAPDLAMLERFGWDPHQGRLVSTFLDPNFVGGFLAVAAALALPQLMVSKTKPRQWFWGIILLLTIVGIYLTFSRSSMLALLVALGVIGLLRYRLVAFLLIGLVVVSVLLSPRWLERGRGALTVDETAQYRIVSWQEGLNIIKSEPLIGVGFNTLPDTRQNYGYALSGHAASGFDSSLLTVGATTGGLGLIAYLMMLGSILLMTWRKWRAGYSPISLSLLAASSALLVHSLFVNSLLYPTILVVWWIIVGVVWAI